MTSCCDNITTMPTHESGSKKSALGERRSTFYLFMRSQVSLHQLYHLSEMMFTSTSGDHRVESTCWTNSSSHFLLHLLCICVSDPLCGVDPEMFCGTFTSLSLLPPPIFLQSRHPHQHVSGAVRVSIYATSDQHPVCRLECLFLTTPPFSPHSPSPIVLSPRLSPDCTACCLPACLPDPMAEHVTETPPMSPYHHLLLFSKASN